MSYTHFDKEHRSLFVNLSIVQLCQTCVFEKRDYQFEFSPIVKLIGFKQNDEILMGLKKKIPFLNCFFNKSIWDKENFNFLIFENNSEKGVYSNLPKHYKKIIIIKNKKNKKKGN